MFSMPSRSTPRIAAATLCVLASLVFAGGCDARTPSAGAARSDAAPLATRWLVVCSSTDDANDTRLLLGLAADGRRVTRFEIVTPDFLWNIPGQPETPRFPAGQSDASPDLAGALRFEAIIDAAGELRLLDFGAPEPDAVQLKGLRGSRALHESWLNGRALGSLFHAATGNLVEIAPVQCRRSEETHAPARP